MSNKNIKIESTDVDKYIDKIREKIDPLIDIINIEDLPMVRVPSNHIVNPEYSVVADIFKEFDPMESYLSNKIALKKEQKELLHIQSRDKGELYDYALKRFVADKLAIEYRESLQSLEDKKVELKNDIRLKGYYIAAKVVCQSAIFKIANKNADFDPNSYDIEIEMPKEDNIKKQKKKKKMKF